jgi:hypothetical protein
MTRIKSLLQSAVLGLGLTMGLGVGLTLANATPAYASEGAASMDALAGEKEINDALVIMAAAEKIQRECSSIGGRLFRARAYGQRVVDMAVGKGYSEDAIRAFIDDDTEKARVRAERNAYFEARGASNHDPQSLCVLGRNEIAQQSPIGYFLREK